MKIKEARQHIEFEVAGKDCRALMRLGGIREVSITDCTKKKAYKALLLTLKRMEIVK